MERKERSELPRFVEIAPLREPHSLERCRLPLSRAAAKAVEGKGRRPLQEGRVEVIRCFPSSERSRNRRRPMWNKPECAHRDSKGGGGRHRHDGDRYSTPRIGDLDRTQPDQHDDDRRERCGQHIAEVAPTRPTTHRLTRRPQPTLRMPPATAAAAASLRVSRAARSDQKAERTGGRVVLHHGWTEHRVQIAFSGPNDPG